MANTAVAGLCGAQRVALSMLQVLHDLLDGSPEIRNVVFDRLPNHFVVDAEIMVDEFITHLGHIGPWNIGVAFTELRAELFRCFPNNFKTSGKCFLVSHVVRKFRSGNLTARLFKVEQLFVYVAEKFKRRSGHIQSAQELKGQCKDSNLPVSPCRLDVQGVLQENQRRR